MKLALVFPGQGSQHVGMGVPLAGAFAAARDVFEEVDEALGRNLFRIMAEGPEADLTATQNAQPALMAMSMAVVRVLQIEGGFAPSEVAAFAAGHSLGEYAALAAAGTLSLADAARLLDARGAAMARAAEANTGGKGGMTALLGVALATAEQAASAAAADTGATCVVANDNAPGQVVISGHVAALDKAEELARAAGAKRAVRLDVSAAFHSPLMAPAADELRDALDAAEFGQALPAVIANVTAEPETDGAAFRQLLVRQVTGRVRWRETIEAMVAAEVDTIVELGAGRVLSGLGRRIHRELSCAPIETPIDVEAFLDSL